MAYDQKIQMSITDTETGQYYTASLQQTGNYIVTPVTSAQPVFIDTLPDGWGNIQIDLERDNTYHGVFRSMTNTPFKFSEGGRAILQSIFKAQGLRADITLTIYIHNATDPMVWTYDVLYKSQFDFTGYRDSLSNMLVTIGTLDSGLIRAIHSWGDTKFNIPMWRSYGGTYVLNDCEPIWHPGIKLLFNATYVAALSHHDATMTPPDALLYQIFGFNHGKHATSGPDQGRHTIPFLGNYNPVQNNGATTFIGNTILQPFLVQGNQSAGVDGANELNFSGVNESQPYTRNNNSLFVNFDTDFPVGGIELSIAVTGKWIDQDITYFDNGRTCFIGFALFEIDGNNNPVTDPITGHYQYQLIYKQDLPGVGGGGGTFRPSPAAFSNYTSPSTITIHNNRAYVIGVIYDEEFPAGGLSGDGSKFADVGWETLKFNILSNHDSGISGIPIPAPSFPGSIALGFRLHTLLEKIVPMLDTTQTDPYGFPIAVDTDFQGISTFLSDPAANAGGDMNPYQIMWTSAYNIHNLSGQSYVTLSFNELYDFCFKQVGIGAWVQDNKVYFDRLRKIYDTTTLLWDFGTDVSDFELFPLTQGLGANLKLGYSAIDTNSNFGIIPINTELYFNTPAIAVKNTMDFEESGVIADPIPIELSRSQRVTQPIGSNIAPGNPSSDNQSIVLYCEPSATPFSAPIFDPADNPFPTPYGANFVEMYPTAQATDPTAAAAPFISGTYYPDTTPNIKLSPARALQRDLGAYVHSLLDNMDSERLTFRNTFVMQYNNSVAGLTGIQSNLNIGGVTAPVVEFSDKGIDDLPNQLFRGIGCKFKSKSAIPLYSILNANPNGYMQLTWNKKGYGNKVYKFFIDKVKLNLATGEASYFEGRLTPDMSI